MLLKIYFAFAIISPVLYSVYVDVTDKANAVLAVITLIVFTSPLLYGLYLSVVGINCPICDQHKITEIGNREWICQDCGHHVWL